MNSTYKYFDLNTDISQLFEEKLKKLEWFYSIFLTRPYFNVLNFEFIKISVNIYRNYSWDRIFDHFTITLCICIKLSNNVIFKNSVFTLTYFFRTSVHWLSSIKITFCVAVKKLLFLNSIKSTHYVEWWPIINS